MIRDRNYVIHAYPSQIRQWERAAEFALKRKRKTGWWVRAMLNAAHAGIIELAFTERQMTRGAVSPVDELRAFNMRVSSEEVTNWQRSAKAEGLECSEWQRQVLDHGSRPGFGIDLSAPPVKKKVKRRA